MSIYQTLSLQKKIFVKILCSGHLKGQLKLRQTFLAYIPFPQRIGNSSDPSKSAQPVTWQKESWDSDLQLLSYEVKF